MLVTLWAVPLGALALSWRSAEAELQRTTEHPTAVQATVGSRDVAAKQSVAVAVEFGAAVNALGQASGTITSVDVEPGSRVTTGQKLFTIDNSPVLAVVGGMPLYRDLHKADSGADVLALSKILSAAGFLNESAIGSHFGSALDAAVKRFNARAGLEADAVFESRRVIYLPDDFGEISSVSVSTGQVVNGSWPALTGSERVDKVTIRAASPGATLRGLDEGGVTALLGTTRVELSSLTPSRAEGESLVAALKQATARGDVTLTTGDSGEKESRLYTGTLLQSQKKTHQGVVPSTSIYTSTSKKSCLFVSRRPDNDKAPTIEKVTTLSEILADSAGVGQTLVDPALIGKTVIRDPSALSPQDLSRCA